MEAKKNMNVDEEVKKLREAWAKEKGDMQTNLTKLQEDCKSIQE